MWYKLLRSGCPARDAASWQARTRPQNKNVVYASRLCTGFRRNGSPRSPIIISAFVATRLLAFPLGLSVSISDGEATYSKLPLAVGIYAALLSSLLLCRRRVSFIILYCVLCAALALNVNGCYKIANHNLEELH
jgi:hypothetical protein